MSMKMIKSRLFAMLLFLPTTVLAASFEDVFTDTDGTDVSSHTPTVGTAWTTTGGTADNAQINASNQLKAVSIGVRNITRADDLGDADHQVWFQFPTLTKSVNSRVCIRLNATTDMGLCAAMESTSSIEITKRTAGTTTGLETLTGRSNGIWVRLKAVGDTISWWTATGSEPTDPTEDTNWTEEAGSPATNANVNTETKAGLWLDGTSAIHTEADPWIDNFRASVVPSAGGTAVPIILQSTGDL